MITLLSCITFKFSCRDSKNSASLCHKNANCYYNVTTNGHKCKCKDGYQVDGYKNGDPKNPICIDNCIERSTKTPYCKSQGTCLKVCFVINALLQFMIMLKVVNTHHQSINQYFF